MIKNTEFGAAEAYQAPACAVLSFEEGQALCQTSLNGGEIEPGTGENWGPF